MNPDSHDTPTSRATTGKPSKLRDSCRACALSKVKCHKEKPSCSRCLQRKIDCEYVATKRPGRKRETSQATAANNHSNDESNNIVKPTSPFSNRGHIHLWPGNNVEVPSIQSAFPASNYFAADLGSHLDLSPISQHVSGPSFSLSDIFTTPLESSLSSAIAGVGNEFDEFFTSPKDFHENSIFAQESSDIHLVSASKASSANRTNESTISTPSSPSLNGQTPSVFDTGLDSASDSTCHCLVQTLDFMKKLSSIKNSSVQTVVAENKQVIETVGNMLQCSCADEGYLLTMLAMVAFKILGRYAAAVRKQPEAVTKESEKISDSAEMQPPSSKGPADESIWRIAAQLILSELHRVQRLVNQLSSKLKSYGIEAGHTGAKNDNGHSQLNLEREAPFSATTLNQIEIDLRKSMGNLSSEIISMLRQS